LKALVGSVAGRQSLDDAQSEWLAYRQKTCGAIELFFAGGSGQAGFVARCQIQLTRSRMKDLDAIYNFPLHH
jgi:uncharacterized protein YecT (DUF1311 family)